MIIIRSRQILKALKSVCLENKEKLYLANSKDIISLIVELSLTEFWPTLKVDKQLILKYQSHHSKDNNYIQLQNEIEKD